MTARKQLGDFGERVAPQHLDRVSPISALGDFGERVAAAHLCATGQTYGDPAGVDDPV